MDIIEKTIEKQTNISTYQALNSKTWEDFEKMAEQKKVLLFGIGACAEYYFFRYGLSLPVVYAIDNNKSGRKLYDVFFYLNGSNIGEVVVQDERALKNIDGNEVVAVVCSTNHGDEFIKKLYENNIKNVFILHNMELNRRKIMNISDSAPISGEDRNALYDKNLKTLPIIANKIVVYAFGSYSDHGKYISEQLYRMRQDIDIVWILKKEYTDDVNIPPYVRVLCDNEYKEIRFEMLTAKIWLFNIEVPSFIEKKDGQIYIQAKHWASVTLKKCYLDSKTLINSPRIANWRRNSSMMDYIITGSPFDSDFCRRAFGFKGNTLEFGSPRSDILFAAEEANRKVREKYGIPHTAKVVMYAPTFRYKDGDCSQRCEYRIDLNFNKVREALETRFGGEWHILLRLHPNVLRYMDEMELEPWVHNVTEYADSQELVATSDILISDFSSIMFEPAFVHKPVFLLVTDYDSYVDKEYELAISYETLPFDRAETNEELAENIVKFEESPYIERVDSFLEKYGVHEDGMASERAAEFILGLI